MIDPIPTEMAQKIANCLYAGRKIEAIKLYRDHTGKGLKESKDFIEALEAKLLSKEPEKFTAPPASNGKGCLMSGFIVLAVFIFLIIILFARSK
ncbi:MAG: hypothetical protein A2283_07750 [Lentisphaerae bacterium RIFOXYA12_FULL_48_11]|nr:MAG: hypothetical protein A2283_07750 [Lentisphaerae bacterium RIFOXYA12_FULL_48_11]